MSKEAERVTEATGAEASKAALIATVPVQLMRRDSNKDTLSKLTRVLVVLGIIAVVLFATATIMGSMVSHHDQFPDVQPDAQKQEFHELKGMTEANAKAYITKVNPALKAHVMGPKDMWTRDYNTERVRIVVDPATGLVTNQPVVG